MAKVRISPRARDDAYGIWSYIMRDNQIAADRWLDSLDEVYATLSAHPRLGPARPDLGKDIRYFPMGSYLILYREHDEGVEIIRVLHGARDIAALFHADET